MSTPGEEAAAEAYLASAVDRLSEALARGERPSLEEVLARHPGAAEGLKDLWPVLVVADEAARGLDGGVDLHFPPEPEAAPESVEDFEIEAELGRGGMGVVYRARQLSLGRTVALKVLRAGDLATEADVLRFRAEARAAGALTHPNIVPVHAVGTSRGRPWFAMGFVDGPTLAEKLRGGPLPGREAARLLLPVARAVDHAHHAGILHRDIKPSNVLIDRDGTPFLADFGLARRMHDADLLTRSSLAVGTPAYMAPEQAAGDRGRLTPATDVFGLGAVLYHMLGGRPPFLGATPVDTMMAVLHEDPPPLRLLNPGVDRELEMIVLKALQKPPELRYPAAAALAADLESWLAGEPTAARSGRFRHVLTQALGETYHAPVLESWGKLWMNHSAVIFATCVVTNVFQWWGFVSPLPYLALWIVGFGTWALVFWRLRRRAGPVTFVERQVAHVWGACAVGGIATYLVETAMGLPLLHLAPMLGVLSGVQWIVKAGTLSGVFYFHAVFHFGVAVLMARFPAVAMTLFGAANALSFFLPGLKYHRRSRARPRDPAPLPGPGP